MTDATCVPLRALGLTAECAQTPDRLADLLQCMADLLVETAKQRTDLAQHQRDNDDPRVRDAIARLYELESSLAEVGAKAAAVHQQLQHVHVI
jgi:hypothetical protein